MQPPLHWLEGGWGWRNCSLLSLDLRLGEVRNVLLQGDLIMRLREVDLQLPNAPFAAQPLQPQNICDALPAPPPTVNRHFRGAPQIPDTVLVRCMSRA